MARSSIRLHWLFAAAAALGAILGTARVKTNEGDDVVTATATAPHAKASTVSEANSAAASEGLPMLGERPRAIPRAEGNAFAALSWLPPRPPPKPAPALIAPPPLPPEPVVEATPPPLPFAFIGMVERGAGKPQAFLTKGEALLVVASGDALENNTYRVDSLSSAAVVLTYLPMGRQQTLNVTGASP